MNAECQDDFTEMMRHVSTSYAGYRDKVTGLESRLEALTQTIRERIRIAANPDESTVAMTEWLGFFHERHMSLRARGQFAADSQRAGICPPSLVKLDGSSILLRLPSFESGHRESIARLVESHRQDLTSCRLLLIDLRGNTGGADVCFEPLIELLYTDPIQVIGCDFLASEENTTYLRELVPQMDLQAEVRDWLRDLVRRMEAQPGCFVSGAPDRTDTLGAVLEHPERVGILMDGKCASAAEEFLVRARQSRKVTLFGAHTKGCLDYANVRQIDLPSCLRVLTIPMSRSRRLPGESVDAAGISPDVPIPLGVEDQVTFVREHYAERAAIERSGT